MGALYKGLYANGEGPQLPSCAAPRRIVLPHTDRWQRGDQSPNSPHSLFEEEDEGDTSDAEEDEGSELRECGKCAADSDAVTDCFFCSCNQHKVRPVNSGCEQLSNQGHRTFQRLLLELASEHYRALMEVQTDGKIKVPPRASRPPRPKEVANVPPEISECSQSEENGGARVETPTSQLLNPLTPTFTTRHPLDGRVVTPEEPKKKKASRRLSNFSDFTRLSFGENTTSGRMSPFDLVSDNGSLQRRKGTLTRLKTSFMHMSRYRDRRPGDEVAERQSCSRRIFDSIVSGNAFNFCTSIAILLNSALYGWVANESVAEAVAGGEPDAVAKKYEWMTLLFTVCFSLELIVRIHRIGFREFFWSEDWSWNWFDFLVVGGDVCQTVIEVTTELGQGERNSSIIHQLTVVRMLRILRITRAVRMFRFIRKCRELRMMIFSVLRSGSALLWSLALLLCFNYLFSVYFVQVLAYHFNAVNVNVAPALDHNQEYAEQLTEMFGNIWKAEYTLYQSVAGGISWGEVSGLLLEIHVVHAVIFCLFHFFTTFALLNIITGIFVESAIHSARNTQEEIAQEQLSTTEQLLFEMRRIFEKADKDRSGTITLNEFEDYLATKEVKAYLDALGIEVDKAKGLFQLLDLDMSGEITVEEFTFGCLRLKGGAKSIDLATLMNHTRRMGDQMRRFYQWAEVQFRRLHDFEARVEDRLSFLNIDVTEPICEDSQSPIVPEQGRSSKGTPSSEGRFRPSVLSSS